MSRRRAEPVQRPVAVAGVPQGLELRHLRYFVALADAGSFSHAAERLFIAQPTLSQQIKRLEEIVGTRLLQRRREGLRLTAAGQVLLDAARKVLSLVDYELSRTRQAAGLGRQQVRVVLPPGLPAALAGPVAGALLSAAAVAEVDVVWLESALDAEFSLIHTRRADAGLGWLTTSPDGLPAPLDAMILGRFEPDVWIPSTHAAAYRGTISLDELAGLDVIHGPRRAQAGTYDAWSRVMQAANPRFQFTDPPLQRSLPMTGTVGFGPQRAAAEAAVAGLTGVRNVNNEVEVWDDADPIEVTVRVQDALDRYALIPDDSDVLVDTSGNTVTLTGHVRTWAEHDAAIGAAWMAIGVFDVRDEIYVTG